jgi:hypothetical protein
MQYGIIFAGMAGVAFLVDYLYPRLNTVTS